MDILKAPEDKFLSSKSKPIRETIEITSGVSYCEEKKYGPDSSKKYAIGG